MVELGKASGGINNRTDKSGLPLNQNGIPTHVRNATNVLVNNAGAFSSLDGQERVYTGVGIRDGFSCPAGAFIREGATVKKFTPPSTTETVLEGVTGTRIAWCYHQGNVYFSDGLISKKIDSNGTVTNWGIAPPTSPPLLSGNNIYGEGQIMACYTYVDSDGRESGSSPVVISESGRVVSALLSSPDAQVVASKIYLTTPNDSTFFHAATVIPGESSIEVTDDYRANGILQTRNKTNPAPADIIRSFGAHILLAVGDTVYWTDEWANDLISQGEENEGLSRVNFWRFPVDVTVMEPVEGGVWIVADSTYWVAGKSPKDAEPVVITENTATFGTSLVDSSGNAVWMSDDGEFVGGPGGQHDLPQYKDVVVDRADTGATIEMHQNGSSVKITTLVQPTANPLRNRTWNPVGVMT